MAYRELIKTKRAVPQKGTTGAGNRPKYTPDEFRQLVDGYLDEIATGDTPRIPVINHFAMTIKVSREQLYKFYRENSEYKEAYAELTQARDGMTEYYLVNPDESRRGASIIFASKNYLGMTDKQEIEHSEKVVDSGEHEW